eukprot:TRINITY_DN61786_c0_g1_i1.p1 TRINITY_DN61786_c0_g1~~TRINITY_DN61786_c0_g1_i1.p1  ORF type:complete len:471 (-),score=71.91 TRINITY_DN61786_c0_g1_i1:56-1468(-)
MSNGRNDAALVMVDTNDHSSGISAKEAACEDDTCPQGPPPGISMQPQHVLASSLPSRWGLAGRASKFGAYLKPKQSTFIRHAVNEEDDYGLVGSVEKNRGCIASVPFCSYPEFDGGVGEIRPTPSRNRRKLFLVPTDNDFESEDSNEFCDDDGKPLYKPRQRGIPMLSAGNLECQVAVPHAVVQAQESTLKIPNEVKQAAPIASLATFQRERKLAVARSAPLDNPNPHRFSLPSAVCCQRTGEADGADIEEDSVEEQNWHDRKSLTGAVARVVYYRVGATSPLDDILGLRRTSTGRIVVAKVRESGQAFRAGVDLGFELVSINGCRFFHGLEPEELRKSIVAPATLIFVGFVGKLQPEVKIKHPMSRYSCGISKNTSFLVTKAAGISDVRVLDEADSIFIASDQEEALRAANGEAAPRRTWTEMEGMPVSANPESAPNDTVLYELRRIEARGLLQKALSTTDGYTRDFSI